MKHNQKTRKAMAFIISIAMIMSLTAISSVTAFAADTSKTSSTYSITDATGFVFSDAGITVTEGAYRRRDRFQRHDQSHRRND